MPDRMLAQQFRSKLVNFTDQTTTAKIETSFLIRLHTMLNWLKPDPIKRLQAEFSRKMKEARDVQRSGDIVRYSAIVAEAEEIGKQIDVLKSTN